MNGADFILDALVKEGATHLFMVPGGLVDPFLPALARVPQLVPVVAAHEAGAVYMADGFARASGSFGAALGIGGPGLGNMATAVAAAKTDSSPLLVLSGEIALQMEGLGEFQDASQSTLDDRALMKSLTRFSESIGSVPNLNHSLHRALGAMWSQPRGPVHLSLSRDVLTGNTSARYEPFMRVFKDVAPLDEKQAAGATAVLGDATQLQNGRIAFLAGAGVEHDDATTQLRAIAERWSIPVATTLRAKGVIPEDHPLSLGVFGYAGTRHATAAMLGGELEVLVVLGSALGERDSMHWALAEHCSAVTIHVNTVIEDLAMQQSSGSSAVFGSAGAFLEFIMQRADTVSETLDRTRAARLAWLGNITKTPRVYDVENCTSSAAPIHPAAAVTALRKALPADGIVLVDSGAHRAFTGHYWTSYGPRTYISATNLGPMGWAIPAAIGAQLARPDFRVAVITGDGCMQMHGMELQTAARYKLPIVYMVLNNGALGNVWLRAHTEGPLPSELTSIPDHDWAGFGRALGANGVTVNDPAQLVPALAKALDSKRTTVVDVKAEKNCPTPVYDFRANAATWSYHE